MLFKLRKETACSLYFVALVIAIILVNFGVEYSLEIGLIFIIGIKVMLFLIRITYLVS